MKLEIKINNIDPQPALIDPIKQILTDCMKEVGLKLEDVQTVVITDEDNFGETVKCYDHSGEYTKNQYYVAAGKTFSLEKKDGKITNAIVLNAFVFESIFNAYKNYKTFDEWESIELLNFYVIYHEFGHCLDNLYRQKVTQQISSRERLLSNFRLNVLKNYYSDILLAEFAASVFSAKGMHSKAYDHELQTTNSTIVQRLEKLEELKEKHRLKKILLGDFAYTVADTFWMILIQYAKLCGVLLGNSHLSNKAISVWENANDRSVQIIKAFTQELQDHWKYYPNFENQINDMLFSKWCSLTLANGYQFIEGEENDGLYW